MIAYKKCLIIKLKVSICVYSYTRSIFGIFHGTQSEVGFCEEIEIPKLNNIDGK